MKRSITPSVSIQFNGWNLVIPNGAVLEIVTTNWVGDIENGIGPTIDWRGNSLVCFCWQSFLTNNWQKHSESSRAVVVVEPFSAEYGKKAYGLLCQEPPKQFRIVKSRIQPFHHEAEAAAVCFLFDSNPHVVLAPDMFEKISAQKISIRG
ncbi:MAG: chemotaxis protein CheW [Pseudomonadota bacterium]